MHALNPREFISVAKRETSNNPKLLPCDGRYCRSLYLLDLTDV